MDLETLRHILFSLRELEDYVYHAIKDEERSLFRSKFSILPGGLDNTPSGKIINFGDVLTPQKETDDMILNVPGVSVCAKARPDGRFQGYFTYDGRKIYVYGTSPDDVRHKILYLIKNGVPKRTRKAKKKTSSSPSLSEWLVKWLELYKKPNVKPTTFSSLTNGVNILNRSFGTVRIDAIKSDDLQKFLSEYKHSRQRDVLLTILRQAFEKAVKTGLLKKNPVSVVEVKKHVSAHKYALTREDQAALCLAVKGLSIETLFLFLLSTGLRVGEALALTSSDFDFEKGTVNVSKNVVFIKGKRIVQNSPKTSAGFRTVPVPANVLDLVRGKSGEIFPMTYNAVRLTFRRLQEETGIKISAHVLRHTYATRLEEAGISPKVKMYLLGHSSIEMTQNTYTDVQKDYVDTLHNSITSIFT